jgi:hypothetical protein
MLAQKIAAELAPTRVAQNAILKIFTLPRERHDPIRKVIANPGRKRRNKITKRVRIMELADG